MIKDHMSLPYSREEHDRSFPGHSHLYLCIDVGGLHNKYVCSHVLRYE